MTDPYQPPSPSPLAVPGTAASGVPAAAAAPAGPVAPPTGATLTPPAQPVAWGAAIKRRNVVGVWLGLPLITLGIYSFVWWYKVNEEMAAFDRRRPVSPGMTLLAFLVGWIIIVPPYVACYRTGVRIAERQRAAGLVPTCNGWIGLLLTMLFGLHTLYYQSELNKIADRYPGAAPGTQVPLYV